MQLFAKAHKLVSARGYAFSTLPKVNFKPKPYTGPSKQQVKELRAKHLNPAIFTYYADPIMLTDGYMQYLFDETGKQYLDLLGGILTVSVGHQHPYINERVFEQYKKVQHTSTIYLNPQIALLAKSLSDKLPSGLDVVYFVNSGSEANDLALTMARLHTKNFDFLAFKNSYHGCAGATMGLTSQHTWKLHLPYQAGIHHVSLPDPYFSNYEAKDVVAKSLRDLEQTIQFSTTGKVAGIIHEPIQGVGGFTTTGSPEYMRAAYETVRKYGGVCIADEVQTGFGRTGTNYWGFQNQGVMPDMVTMAKGLGNGAAIAAVVSTKEIAECLKGKIHFNTFGGNPISMTQALATLEVIDNEKTQKNCVERGNEFTEGFRKIQKKYPGVVGDVRGQGLMQAVEFVKDPKSKEPNRDLFTFLMEELREDGVLVGRGGLFGNVCRIGPPMCLTKEDVSYALWALDKALTKSGSK